MTFAFRHLGALCFVAAFAITPIAQAQEAAKPVTSTKPKAVAVRCAVESRTCVVSLLPEGTHVAKGDVVCELDPAAVKVQLAEQSKKVSASDVVYRKAKTTREDAEREINAYLEGPYQFELQELQGRLAAAQNDFKRATDKLDSSKQLFVKGLLSPSRHSLAESAVERAKTKLDQIEGRKNLFEKYTKAKATIVLKADVEKARSEELVKQAELERERDVERKLSRQIDACKVVAPVAGLVSYPKGVEEAADVNKGDLVCRVIPDENAEQDKDAPKAKAAAKVQEEKSFEREITVTVKLNYLLYLPDGYETDKGKRWPLMLFLHGAGESGDDLSKVKAHGPPKIVESKKDFPFIVVSPQSAGRGWNPDSLYAMLENVKTTYRVDPDRVYLTGLSMGGYGSWTLAAAHPEVFAAVAPICGGGSPRDASKIKNLPIWVFHGAKDPVVPLVRSEEMVKALKDAGAGEVKFTVYPEAGHDSWTETYNNPELYKWLLGHSRKK